MHLCRNQRLRIFCEQYPISTCALRSFRTLTVKTQSLVFTKFSSKELYPQDYSAHLEEWLKAHPFCMREVMEKWHWHQDAKADVERERWNAECPSRASVRDLVSRIEASPIPSMPAASRKSCADDRAPRWTPKKLRRVRGVRLPRNAEWS